MTYLDFVLVIGSVDAFLVLITFSEMVSDALVLVNVFVNLKLT